MKGGFNINPNLTDIRVLITGGNGFVGSHLARKLLAEKSNVSILDTSKSNDWRIQDIKDKVRIFGADLRDLPTIKNIVKKIEPDKIYHLGAFTDVGRDFHNLDNAIKVNIQGTVNLLHALDGTDYNSFLHTSSSEVYGTNKPPFKEDQKICPVSPYSVSKASTELFCRMFYEVHGCPIVTIRPFTIYGPNQRRSMFVPQLITSCLQGKDFEMTKGEQTRDFIYVEDVVDGFVKASLNKRAIGEIINLGTGKEISIKDLAFKIVKMTGTKINLLFGALDYRPAEIWRMFSDSSKAKDILNWVPKYSLDEGLKETINCYMENFHKDL